MIQSLQTVGYVAPWLYDVLEFFDPILRMFCLWEFKYS